MIPKIIHYCWLSEENFPDKIKECVKTWDILLQQNYTLILWNLEKVKNEIPIIPYLQEALELKKWAAAADYIRTYAVHKYGGFYFDTDVEVLKPFPDNLLNYSFVTGLEGRGKKERIKSVYPEFEIPITGINCALFGAEKNHKILKDILNWWETHPFILPNGTHQNTHIIGPEIYEQIFEKYGYKDKLERQEFNNILISNYFEEFSCWASYKTDKTLAIHNCFGQWLPIKKTINYIWLSNDKIPEDTKQIMNSWNIQKDWLIKKWGWDDFPEEIKNKKWIKSTYNKKNWAACSDYLRLWIIYNYGGFYFDTDVEIKKYITDHINKENFIIGYQCDNFLECGIFGSIPYNKNLKKLMDWYENIEFDPDYMILDKCKNLPQPLERIYTAPNLWTRLLKKEVENKEIIPYSYDYFSAKNYMTNKYNITNNTYTVHHYKGSWLKKEFKITDFGFTF